MQRRAFLTALGATAATPVLADAAPVRLAIARMTHTHVPWLLDREPRSDIELVGIWEPDRTVAQKYAARSNLPPRLFHDDLRRMLVETRAEAVAAFGSIAEHRQVVEVCAPLGVHILVEKPLDFSYAEAEAMAALARRHGVLLLTNFETTWHASNAVLAEQLRAGAVGRLRKAVIRDGHWGPAEIGCPPEFMAWLTDPEQNGGGAIVDFGCYGANIMTWLKDGAALETVTAVTRRLKTDPQYARVDDEATIILDYPDCQAIIEASWNWPDHRKDLQLFGETGYLFAPDRDHAVIRRRGESAETALPVPGLARPDDDPFAYLAAAVRGRVVPPHDRNGLDNAVVVARILDAARQSARTGRRISL